MARERVEKEVSWGYIEAITPEKESETLDGS